MIAGRRKRGNCRLVEPVTHFLTGACLGRAGFNRTTALATATMTLAAEAPDLDMIGQLRGPVFGFAHHRGFTHSFLGLLIVAGAVVAFMYGIWRLRGRKTTGGPAPRWGLLFVYAYIAGLSHILLDFTNNYGVRPFWPFWEKWYSWDIVFIIEPLILVILGAGLVLPAFFGLINEEIAGRRKGLQGRFGAVLALLALVGLWGVRDYEHRRAVAALQSRTYKRADAIRVSAYPHLLTPFRWYGVVETRDFFAQTTVNSLSPEVDPDDKMRIRPKPEETPVTLAAKKSYLGRVYLDWAQFPITETEPLESPSGYIVRFRDLRYEYPERSGASSLGARVRLDQNLNVVGQMFGFGSRWGQPSEEK